MLSKRKRTRFPRWWWSINSPSTSNSSYLNTTPSTAEVKNKYSTTRLDCSDFFSMGMTTTTVNNNTKGSAFHTPQTYGNCNFCCLLLGCGQAGRNPITLDNSYQSSEPTPCSRRRPSVRPTARSHHRSWTKVAIIKSLLLGRFCDVHARRVIHYYAGISWSLPGAPVMRLPRPLIRQIVPLSTVLKIIIGNNS